MDPQIGDLATPGGLPQAPGWVVGVLRNGKPVHVKRYGFADLGQERKTKLPGKR